MNTYNKSYINDKNKNNSKIYYLLTIIFMSFFCAMLLIFDETKPNCYLFLPMLPITFAFCSCIAVNVYQYLFKKMSVTIIILTYFIRMVVLPFVMFLSNYSISFGRYTVAISYDLIYENMGKAILLMSYEALAIFILLATSKFTYKKFFDNNNTFKVDNIFSKKSTIFKIIIITLILFIGILIYLYPVLSNYMSFFISTSQEKDFANMIALSVMKTSVPSVIYWLYILFFELIQVFLPILALQLIYKKYGQHKQKRAILFSLIIIMIVFSFMTSEKATSVLLAIVLFKIISMLYTQKIRKITPWVMIIMALFSIMGLFFKSGFYNYNNNVWEFTSTTFNAYFSGPLNVAASISMQEDASIKVIASDIINSIPFMGHFFKEWDTTSKYFNYTIKGNGAAVTKIIPMVGQAYYYFGFILAPIISCLCVKMSIRFEKKAEKNSDIFKIFIYMFATGLLAMSPVLYNFNIMLKNLWDILIYLLIMKIAYTKLH